MSTSDNISLFSENLTECDIISIDTTVSTDTENQLIHKQKQNHPVRKFLEPNINNNKTVLCSLCKSCFLRNTGIITIKRHFEKKHEDAYKQIKQDLQNTIIPYTEDDIEKVDLINSHLYGWIISAQLPFSAVENKELRALFSIFDPRYKLSTRQTVSHNINEIFIKQKTIIYNLLSSLEQKFSITTDAWTACTNQAYISITLHWIDKNWDMKHILLDFIPICERHTGIVFAENIFNTLKEYNIEKKILAVTTDNAANMITFGQQLKIKLENECNNVEFMHFRCAAHILNLAVQEGIKLISELIEKARKFASKIRNSLSLFEELKKIFEMKNQPFLVPEVDVPTRWNSLYLSIQKLHRIKNMTDILVASNCQLKQIYPTDDDWQDINVSIFILLLLIKN